MSSIDPSTRIDDEKKPLTEYFLMDNRSRRALIYDVARTSLDPVQGIARVVTRPRIYKKNLKFPATDVDVNEDSLGAALVCLHL